MPTAFTGAMEAPHPIRFVDRPFAYISTNKLLGKVDVISKRSIHDFEGDGIAEVVYQDECMVRVYRGTDGEVLLEVENSSATIHEYPLVVDVHIALHEGKAIISQGMIQLVVEQIHSVNLEVFLPA